METNEIITNDEVMEKAEEVVTSTGSGKTLRTLGVIGGVALVGGLAYKYAIKPLISKAKAKKEQDFTGDSDDAEFVDTSFDSDEE